METFWRPVGQGSLARERTEYAIATLFGGDAGEGVDTLDRTVTRRAGQFPGFEGLSKTTQRFRDICRRLNPGKAASLVSLAFSVHLDTIL